MVDPRLEPLVGGIEKVLQQSYELHAALLELLQRKRAALAAADNAGMIELCKLENEKVQMISELEKSRQELVARLTLLVDPNAAAPLALRDLAMKLPEPARTRLLTKRQLLRDRIGQVKEQTSVARKATETLLRHVQGLVRTVNGFAAGGAAYGQRGETPRPKAIAVGSINLVA
ncbi:MAG: flagellar export chaperone FlgN [Phycisphaeraceae bacterium]|nr:flagellar export chaperone FlgN [Phycisphaeraceae bacterium]